MAYAQLAALLHICFSLTWGFPIKAGTLLRIPVTAIVFQVVCYLRMEHFADYVGVHLFMEITVFVRRLVMCLEGAGRQTVMKSVVVLVGLMPVRSGCRSIQFYHDRFISTSSMNLCIQRSPQRSLSTSG